MSQEHPCQRDVLKLTHVLEGVVDGQVVLANPIAGFSQPILPQPAPCLQRRDRTNLGDGTSDIEPFGLVEQGGRPVQVTVNLPESSAGTGKPVGRLAQRSMLAQLLASSQMVRRGFNVVLLAEEVAEPRCKSATPGNIGLWSKPSCSDRS